MTIDQLAQDLRAALELELDAGEKVVWLGQRRPGLLVKQRQSSNTTMLIALVVITACFTAYFVFAWGGMLTLIIGIIAAFTAWGSYSSAENKRLLPTKEVYAATNLRALIVRLDGKNRSINGILLRSLTQFHRDENEDGSGAIRFTVSGEDWPGFGFVDIANVREVEKMLRALATQPAA